MKGAGSLLPDREVSEQDLQELLDSLTDEWDDLDFPRLPPRVSRRLRLILGVDA